jgi:hypothetical protein
LPIGRQVLDSKQKNDVNFVQKEHEYGDEQLPSKDAGVYDQRN